ncbi:hypothetical protein [Nostocoides sp. F2B08]|uniref:hypothetical protein n=1 Tax=Nostocoides sp. F2B08 TaxID=2653936 RepID=UPI00186B2239|nr:hypothetical protein [Tetrasphaera sp. F2B08]
MLDLDALDVEEIVTALNDQTDYEHRWLIDPRTGEIAFRTSDTGIDGENPVDLDDLDLIPIDPARLLVSGSHVRWRTRPSQRPERALCDMRRRGRADTRRRNLLQPQGVPAVRDAAERHASTGRMG